VNLLSRENGFSIKVFIFFKVILAIRAIFETFTIGVFIFFMTRKGWEPKTLFLAFMGLLWIFQTVGWYKLYSIIQKEGLCKSTISLAKKIVGASIFIEIISFFSGSYRPVSSFDWGSFGQQTSSTFLSIYAQYQDIFFGAADLITPIPHAMAACAFLAGLLFSVPKISAD
jgi:hypothetical protein